MIILISLLINLVVQWESVTNLRENVELDSFQNVYVYDENTIEKFDKSGKNHFSYSALRKGELSSLDVTNPLRLALYFGENNEVVFLDNTLTEQGRALNFNDLEYYDVGLVCSSFQNRLWVYRVAEQKLVRLSRNGIVENESGNLALWLDKKQKVNFTQLKESGNFLYLFSDSDLVMVFDHYGTFIKKVRIGQHDNSHVFEKYILLEKEGEILSFNVELRESQKLFDIPVSFKNAASIDFTPNSLAVLNNGKVSFLKDVK